MSESKSERRVSKLKKLWKKARRYETRASELNEQRQDHKTKEGQEYFAICMKWNQACNAEYVAFRKIDQAEATWARECKYES